MPSYNLKIGYFQIDASTSKYDRQNKAFLMVKRALKSVILCMSHIICDMCYYQIGNFYRSTVLRHQNVSFF